MISILVASKSFSVSLEMQQALRQAIESNIPFGLPKIHVSVHSARTIDTVLAVLEEEPITLALVSESLLEDFMRRPLPELCQPERPPNLLSFSETGPALLVDQHVLGRFFGAVDTLHWPHTVESFRSSLHKYMPRVWWYSPLPSPISIARRASRPVGAMSPMSSPPPPRCGPIAGPGGSSVGNGSPRLPLRFGCIGGRVLKFMIVAECELSASTLVDYCASLDIVADVFSTAEAAMAALQTSSTTSSYSTYDLIVIDPDELGGCGGYALCSWIRQHEAEASRRRAPPTTTATPCLDTTTSLATSTPPRAPEVVVLSASLDPATCTAFGADRCLSKPLSPQCFAYAVRGWLASRHQKLPARAPLGQQQAQ